MDADATFQVPAHRDAPVEVAPVQQDMSNEVAHQEDETRVDDQANGAVAQELDVNAHAVGQPITEVDVELAEAPVASQRTSEGAATRVVANDGETSAVDEREDVAVDSEHSPRSDKGKRRMTEAEYADAYPESNTPVLDPPDELPLGMSLEEYHYNMNFKFSGDTVPATKWVTI